MRHPPIATNGPVWTPSPVPDAEPDTVGTVVRWMHAFIDVGADAVETTCAFWAAVTGWPVGAPWPGNPEFHSLEPPTGSAYLHVQRIEGPPRVHLDLMSGDVDADTDAHVAAGATAVEQYRWWQVMASPGGLPYCLVAERHARTRPRASRWPQRHRSRVAQVCVDIPADRFDREVAFWRSVTGWPSVGSHRPEYDRLRPPAECPMFFLLQRLGPGETGPVRVHLDIGTDDVAAEIDRVRALGAELHDATHPWAVFTDPAGLPFCVTPRPPE